MASVVCPTCRKSFDPDAATAMPFCSERCRMADLHRWLTERHGLPAAVEEEDVEGVEDLPDV
jgi:endogenous inhibitor of DNA gyrase (YacG/DUF329 family)